MKAQRIFTWMLALAGIVTFLSTDVFAAGCATDSKAKKNMEKTMKEAEKSLESGNRAEAQRMFRDAASRNACPILAKKCKEEAEALDKEAMEVLERAAELAKTKHKKLDDDELEEFNEGVEETLCECFKMAFFSWPGHQYGSAAGKSYKKLKKKLSRDAKKEVEKKAKEIIGEMNELWQQKDYRSALVCCDRFFNTCSYSKKAGAMVAMRKKIAQKVADLDRQEAEERRRNR